MLRKDYFGPLAVHSVGNRVNSDTLIASGSDALFDATLSTSVLTAALIFIFAKN